MPRESAPETHGHCRYLNGNGVSAETPVAPAPAAGTVTSHREGCQSIPSRAVRPARHRLAGMKERARDQGGPGTLTDDLAIPEVDQAALADEPLAELAARYRLRPSAARPGVFAYAGQLWARRHFIVGFATARNVAMYTEARLGQLWQVLTPLLNAAVYYLIFGLILDTSRGRAELPGLPHHRDIHLQLHPAGVHHHVPGDARQPAPDQGAPVPPRLPADRLRADRARAAGHVHARAYRDRAGHRRAADLVLAARHPRPGDPGRVQRRHGPVPGPAGRRCG